jgi:hypothetical protein
MVFGRRCLEVAETTYSDCEVLYDWRNLSILHSVIPNFGELLSQTNRSIPRHLCLLSPGPFGNRTVQSQDISACYPPVHSGTDCLSYFPRTGPQWLLFLTHACPTRVYILVTASSSLE